MPSKQQVGGSSPSGHTTAFVVQIRTQRIIAFISVKGAAKRSAHFRFL